MQPSKKVILTKKERVTRLQKRWDKLSDKRESNVNRYIIPIELKMSEIKEKLKKLQDS